VLSRNEVINIFFGRYRQYFNGQEAQPVDLADANPERARFYQKLVGKDLAEINAYWSRQLFSGRMQAPPKVGSTEEVLRWINAHPGGIATSSYRRRMPASASCTNWKLIVGARFTGASGVQPNVRAACEFAGQRGLDAQPAAVDGWSIGHPDAGQQQTRQPNCSAKSGCVSLAVGRVAMIGWRCASGGGAAGGGGRQRFSSSSA
jgi:hypothetical protein